MPRSMTGWRFLNVPIDGRPVSRSNFENVVKAAGWSYSEVSAGLDGGSANEGSPPVLPH